MINIYKGNLNKVSPKKKKNLYCHLQQFICCNEKNHMQVTVPEGIMYTVAISPYAVGYFHCLLGIRLGCPGFF